MRLMIAMLFVSVLCTGGCATDQLCAQNLACLEVGECSASGLWCEVGSDADCAASMQCTDHGKCSKVGDFCGVASAADCAKSKDCKLHGRCGVATTEEFNRDNEKVTVNVCSPTEEQHCAASEVCSEFGRCGLSKGKRFDGLPETVCAPTQNAHCAPTEGCLNSGRCSVIQFAGLEMHAECGVASNADCLKSKVCADQNACVASVSGGNLAQPNCSSRFLECRVGCKTAADCQTLPTSSCKFQSDSGPCTWGCGLDCGGGSVCVLQD